MRASEFDFLLPPELIAQVPTPERDLSRLLVLQRPAGAVQHRGFLDLPDYIQPGDVVVLNDSRVIPARLRGLKRGGTGAFEVLLLEANGVNDWWAMLRPGKKAPLNTEIDFAERSGPVTNISATVIEINNEGHRRLRFSGTPDIADDLERLGEIPLPPYIKRENGHWPADIERYQTIYAEHRGSVAAPTAGLHITPRILREFKERGAILCPLTLHVGSGTFAPVKTETLAGHVMHEERFILPAATAEAVNQAKRGGRRVIAVGTTTVRALESVAAQHSGDLVGGSGRTHIFIHPPFSFRIVDALLTNFHLPRSTLLMLVSALAAPGATEGGEIVLRAYAEAVRERYRFFSYGDAMLIL